MTSEKQLVQKWTFMFQNIKKKSIVQCVVFNTSDYVKICMGLLDYLAKMLYLKNKFWNIKTVEKIWTIIYSQKYKQSHTNSFVVECWDDVGMNQWWYFGLWAERGEFDIRQSYF